MANNTEKLKLKTNIPATVKFRFDQPKENDHPEYGKSYIYGVDCEGVQYTLFATELLHQLLGLAGVGKNTAAIITKAEHPEDSRKVTWGVQVGNMAYWSHKDLGQSAPPDSQHQQNPPPNQAQPPNDKPPHPADQGQYSQPNESPQSPPNVNHFRALKQEVAATMDHAYKMAMVIQGIHADPMQDFSAEAFAACAHSLFIELRKSGWKPTSEEVEMTLEKIRQHVGKGEKQSAAK